MRCFRSILHLVKTKYWPLIKSPQTALLLVTGLTGYMSARCPVTHLETILGLTGSLFLAISGSTVLNMWVDRDIDAKMPRTQKRPLPAGLIHPREALLLGLVMAVLGVGWALLLDRLYGLVVAAGLFFDVLVYSLWLKRRTCWSILWGGISGAMPVLAGRVLGIGAIDWVGLVLGAAVLFWIPTHILTFSLRYRYDYQVAGVPTFPSTYGEAITRRLVAFSSMLVALAMAGAAYGLGTSWGYLRLLALLTAGLLILAVGGLVHPSERVNFRLFKYASLYMLGSMLLVAL
jgi:protoheme IX farnesyltransferase